MLLQIFQPFHCWGSDQPRAHYSHTILMKLYLWYSQNGMKRSFLSTYTNFHEIWTFFPFLMFTSLCCHHVNEITPEVTLNWITHTILNLNPIDEYRRSTRACQFHCATFVYVSMSVGRYFICIFFLWKCGEGYPSQDNLLVAALSMMHLDGMEGSERGGEGRTTGRGRM